MIDSTTDTTTGTFLRDARDEKRRTGHASDEDAEEKPEPAVTEPPTDDFEQEPIATD